MSLEKSPQNEILPVVSQATLVHVIISRIISQHQTDYGNTTHTNQTSGGLEYCALGRLDKRHRIFAAHHVAYPQLRWQCMDCAAPVGIGLIGCQCTAAAGIILYERSSGGIGGAYTAFAGVCVFDSLRAA